MSKIKVDVIEDSSANQIRFPSSALVDGYLAVASSGELSSVVAPVKTKSFTIYNASVSGSSGTNGSTNLTVSTTIPADIKADILAGHECIIIGSGVQKMTQGLQFFDAGTNNAYWDLGGNIYAHKRTNELTAGYRTGTSAYRISTVTEGSQTGAVAAYLHTGGFKTRFRVVQNSSESTSYTIDWETIGCTNSDGAQINAHSSVDIAEGNWGLLNTFTQFRIPSLRISPTGMIKLYIQKD